MSVNLELPTADGLRALAPHKNRKNILLPMRQIQAGIEENMQALGVNDSRGRYWHTARELGRKEESTTLLLREQIRQKILLDEKQAANTAAESVPAVLKEDSADIVLLP